MEVDHGSGYRGWIVAIEAWLASRINARGILRLVSYSIHKALCGTRHLEREMSLLNLIRSEPMQK
jgi:hypothetical protein